MYPVTYRKLGSLLQYDTLIKNKSFEMIGKWEKTLVRNFE